jgi:hypothetical protein
VASRLNSEVPTDNEFTRILQWPGYRVYRKIDDKNKTLDLWVRRKRGNRIALTGYKDALDTCLTLCIIIPLM